MRNICCELPEQCICWFDSATVNLMSNCKQTISYQTFKAKLSVFVALDLTGLWNVLLPTYSFRSSGRPWKAPGMMVLMRLCLRSLETEKQKINLSYAGMMMMMMIIMVMVVSQENLHAGVCRTLSRSSFLHLFISWSRCRHQQLRQKSKSQQV